MDLSIFEAGREILAWHNQNKFAVWQTAQEEKDRKIEETKRLHKERLAREPLDLALKLIERHEEAVGKGLVLNKDDYRFALKDSSNNTCVWLRLKPAYYLPVDVPQLHSIEFSLGMVDVFGYQSEHHLATAVYGSDNPKEGTLIHEPGVRADIVDPDNDQSLLSAIIREASMLQGIPILPLRPPINE